VNKVNTLTTYHMPCKTQMPFSSPPTKAIDITLCSVVKIRYWSECVGGCVWVCVGVCGCDCVCVYLVEVRISAAVSCTQSLQGLSM